jgi:hypothetical protein
VVEEPVWAQVGLCDGFPIAGFQMSLLYCDIDQKSNSKDVNVILYSVWRLVFLSVSFGLRGRTFAVKWRLERLTM